MPVEGTVPLPMESDGFESEDVDTTFDHTLKDAASFAHQTKASPARIRKVSLSEQASINEAFQGLQLDHKYMFGQATPFLT
eukprot:2048315-Amphidinium_carterae.2